MKQIRFNAALAFNHYDVHLLEFNYVMNVRAIRCPFEGRYNVFKGELRLKYFTAVMNGHCK